MWEAILPLVGFLIGLVSVMVGLGGGFLVVPLLALVYVFSPANAVGTGLMTILLTVTVASVYYSRQRQIYYKTGLLLSVTAVPGAILGSYLTAVVPGEVIGLLVSFFLVFVAWQMVYKRPPKNNCGNLDQDPGFPEKELLSQKRNLFLGAVLCFFAGLLGGLLSIPGVLLVPIMLLVLRMPFKAVAATSVFTMIFISLAGVSQHLALGSVNIEYALLLGSGSMFGGLLGAHLCRIANIRALHWVLAALLVFISVQMLLKFGFGVNY